MNKLRLMIFVILSSFNSLPAQICDETGSYNKEWTLKARHREETREARQKYYRSLSQEQLERISDIEIYPTDIMKCGMGFSNGLAKIFVNGRAGFINTKGKVVIAPKFKDVGRFSEKLAPVQFKSGKWGYLNPRGEIAIQPAFDWALIFREGLALVQVNAKWGFIDPAGNFVVKPQFDHADSFSEGLAHVQLMREKYYSGYIDKKGNWVIQPVFNGGDDFHQGRAVADQDVKDENGRYKYSTCYLIDRQGRKLEELEECSRTIRRPKLVDSNTPDFFFEEYKTGYRTKAGKIIWTPTK